MKHSSLGTAIFVAGMMAASATNAEFIVSGQPPSLIRVEPGTATFAAGFNGTLADDFGFWWSFPQPGSALGIQPGGVLEASGTSGTSGDFLAAAIGKHVFSPSNEGLDRFRVDYKVQLLSADTSVDFVLFGRNGPREKFSINKSGIEFSARSDADQILRRVPALASTALVDPLSVLIEYDHALGTIRFSVTDDTGQHLEVSTAWTISHAFRVGLQAEKISGIAGTPLARWRDLATTLRIPVHLRGSASPLIDNNAGGILYGDLPLGFSGATYVDPSTPILGGNFVAGTPGSEADVAMPGAPSANYHAMVIETSAGILFPSTARQTLFTTSSLPGESAWPTDFGAATVKAFFPNCFIAPGIPPNPSTTNYWWNADCLSTPASGLDLAVSGWMATPRPGFARKTYVYVSNMGGQTTSAGDVLSITIPPAFTNAVITPPPGATCSTAPAFLCQLPQVGINLHLPFVVDYTVSTSAAPGDAVEVHAELSVNGDTNGNNDEFFIRGLVQAAVDPNDKLAIPEAGPIAPGQRLHYIVRFENVGTLATEFIRITDALDPNLDRASVAFISRGGVYDAANHSISWVLDTPLGPGEQGFVEFRAKARADLLPGATITNRASIQFDFNAPIVTAPVEHFIPAPSAPRPQDILDCLGRLLARGGLPHKARHDVAKAIKDVQHAIRKQARGDLEEALEQVEDAVKHLQKATAHGADLSSCQPLGGLWSWALGLVDQRIAAAAAAAGEKNKNVKKAREERADAVAAQARGHWHRAFEELIDAARYAGKALPRHGHKGRD